MLFKSLIRTCEVENDFVGPLQFILFKILAIFLILKIKLKYNVNQFHIILVFSKFFCFLGNLE